MLWWQRSIIGILHTTKEHSTRYYLYANKLHTFESIVYNFSKYLDFLTQNRHWIWVRYEWILLYVAFCAIMAISLQKEARSQYYDLLLFRMTSRVLYYSVQYNRQHCTLHSFEQFGALYMHNHDDKYPPGPDRDSNLVPPGYKLQSTRMSYRGRQHGLDKLVIEL